MKKHYLRSLPASAAVAAALLSNGSSFITHAWPDEFTTGYKQICTTPSVLTPPNGTGYAPITARVENARFPNNVIGPDEVIHIFYVAQGDGSPKFDARERFLSLVVIFETVGGAAPAPLRGPGLGPGTYHQDDPNVTLTATRNGRDFDIAAVVPLGKGMTLGYGTAFRRGADPELTLIHLIRGSADGLGFDNKRYILNRNEAQFAEFDVVNAGEVVDTHGTPAVSSNFLWLQQPGSDRSYKHADPPWVSWSGRGGYRPTDPDDAMMRNLLVQPTFVYMKPSDTTASVFNVDEAREKRRVALEQRREEEARRKPMLDEQNAAKVRLRAETAAARQAKKLEDGVTSKTTKKRVGKSRKKAAAPPPPAAPCTDPTDPPDASTGA
jgi:hypothetical protein